MFIHSIPISGVYLPTWSSEVTGSSQCGRDTEWSCNQGVYVTFHDKVKTGRQGPPRVCQFSYCSVPLAWKIFREISTTCIMSTS